MSKTTKFLISSAGSLSILIMLVMPALSFAQVPKGIQIENGVTGGLVPCGRAVTSSAKKGDVVGTTAPGTNGENENVVAKVDTGSVVKNPCGFDDAITLVNNIISYILFYLAIPIVAIMFVYAGVLLVTSGGDTGARTKAKSAFLNAAIGLILAFGSYIIIKLILHTLGYNGAWIGF
ncbi:MAG TPA: pilin [Candidatus Paceibacterota bacterium]|jgi:hypothetical protein|nr:pilin [Candidatus Paceibacterota bacterium]